MTHFRPGVWLYPYIRNVPHLLQGPGVEGRNPGRVESLLVRMQTDPIADLLTRIRNASRAKHARVDVPSSKMKNELARILKEEGYISTYKLVEENKVRKTLRVFLKYTPDRRSVITGLKRVSRPGARD